MVLVIASDVFIIDMSTEHLILVIIPQLRWSKPLWIIYKEVMPSPWQCQFYESQLLSFSVF